MSVGGPAGPCGVGSTPVSPQAPRVAHRVQILGFVNVRIRRPGWAYRLRRSAWLQITGGPPQGPLKSRGPSVDPQLRKRSAAVQVWTGIRVGDFPTVHAFQMDLEGVGRTLCNVSHGSGAVQLTNEEVTCSRCIRILVKPKLTSRQKAYLQGWRHGTRDDLKKGPANQKEEALRRAYLQGFEHGLNDLENAEYHGQHYYGEKT